MDAVVGPTPQLALTIVWLKDEGQDFTRFIVDRNNMIVDALPFQGWLWKGYTIEQRPIKRGMLLNLSKPGYPVITLRYPVSSVVLPKDAEGLPQL